MERTVNAALAFSVVLFLACLPFDSFCINGSCSGWPSWGVLAFGFLGISASPANMIWIANPLLITSWLATFRRWTLFPLLLGGSALVLALTFLFAKTAVTNEGGIPFPITGYRTGYWLWLASMTMACIAALLAMVTKKK
jgi:hypothetical protein